MFEKHGDLVMSRDIYKYEFSVDIPIQDVEQSLDLSVLTAESLHGRPQVRLDASFFWTESSVPVLLTLERRLDVI
jgi:hypothetical protein